MTQVIGSWEGVSHQPQATGLLLVHVTPGRVRLRATGNESRSVIETCNRLNQQAGIEEVLTNHKTGSIPIGFNEKKLSLSQVLKAIAQASGVQVQLPVAETRKDPFAAWKSREFWQQQGIDLIPLIAGLTVTGTLGISGLTSIPVYLLAAEATRLAIDFAKNEMGDKEDKEEVKSQKSKVRINSRLPTPPNYKVLHSIPGRIRIHVPRLAKDEAYVQQVVRSLRTDERVTKFRLNRDAASLAITYTPKDVPVSYWMELLHSAEETERKKAEGTQEAEEENRLTTRRSFPIPDSRLPNSQTNEESENSLPFEAIAILPPSSEMETAGLWDRLKPPALSMSLEFMARFPLQTLAK